MYECGGGSNCRLLRGVGDVLRRGVGGVLGGPAAQGVLEQLAFEGGLVDALDVLTHAASSLQSIILPPGS